MHDLAFRLTTTQLTFAVPIGVILGALVGLVGQLIANAADRRKSRDERLWEKRADLYGDALVELTKLGHTLAVLRDAKPDQDQEILKKVTGELDAPLAELEGLQPRILAFASDDVIKHYRAFYKVCFELATWLESLGIPSDDAKMVKLRDQAIADKVKLQKEMQDDLRK